MNKKEVIKLIGKENWKHFQEYMKGQTVGIKNGNIEYYNYDVRHFLDFQNERNKYING